MGTFLPLGGLVLPILLLLLRLPLLCLCSGVQAATGRTSSSSEDTAFDLAVHLGNLSPYGKVPVPRGFKEDLPGDCVVEQVMLVCGISICLAFFSSVRVVEFIGGCFILLCCSGLLVVEAFAGIYELFQCFLTIFIFCVVILENGD